MFCGQRRLFISCNHFDMIYHGNRIPEWFINQNMVHIKVELPQDWCYNKLRRIGVCVILTPKNSYGRKDYYNTPKYFVGNFDRTSLWIRNGRKRMVDLFSMKI